jgi:hypothetical protein
MKSLRFIAILVLTCNPIVLLLCQVTTAPATPEVPDLSSNVIATGTGRTTGHIANLLISNKTNSPVEMLAQDVYIPSGGGYQPYVAKIPRVIISADTSVTIPVHGFCADVHTAPVPPGITMPPLDQWVALEKESLVEAGVPFDHVIDKTVPPFSPAHIPQLITSPGFKSEPPSQTPGIVPTWPGTDILVGGIIDPVKYPETFGPVIIEALLNITKAYGQQKKDNKITTPFSGDPVKEREAVIQQTFWIFMSDITGGKYEKENFKVKTIEQFESSSGSLVASLPADQKKELENGVDQFWDVFTAVGTEAKVLSTEQMQIFPKTDKDKIEEDIEKAKGNQAKGQQTESTTPRPPNMAAPVNTPCLCDSMTYKLQVRRENPKDATRDSVFHKDETAQSLKQENTTKKLPYKNWKQGDTYHISITEIRMHCHCQNITRENGDCDFYAANPISTEKGKVNLKKEPETKQGIAENTKDVKEKNTIKKALRKDSEFIYKFTPKANDKETGQVQITFCLSSVCSSNDCIITNNKVDCGPYCFTISFMK